MRNNRVSGATVRTMTHGKNAGTESLKIAIVSTPKTGNTWLKLLLSEIYGLPMISLPPALSPNGWEDFGARWVSHQHYLPDPALLAWGKKQGVVFVTSVRHPADVLVSLRHYLATRGDTQLGEPADPEHLVGDPGTSFGSHARAYVERGFFYLLQNSISWICGGWSLPVRYEDLYERPLETLRELTGRIHPVSDERLQRAIDRCAIGRLQKRSQSDRQFFRRGGSGGWRTELPADLQSLLFSTEPYRTQLELLGYSLEGAAAIAPGAAGLLASAPIAGEIARELSTTKSAAAALPAADAAVSRLNRRATADSAPAAFPQFTELAYALYRRMPEVQREYPDLWGRDRAAFANWFLHFGLPGLGLHRSFATPIVRSWELGPGAATLRTHREDAA